MVVEIEAAPINPSDLGLMFGAADLSTVRGRADGQPAVLLRCARRRDARDGARVGHWMAVGTKAVVA